MNKSVVIAAIAVGTLYAGAWRAEADFIQTNLVSDLAGLNATIIDPELHNPWGISHSATSPFWVSNQGTSTATLYAVTAGNDVTKVNINPPSGFVAIPPPGGPGPTGQVANPNTSSPSIFPVNGGDGMSAHFIFANLNGTISAWDTGATAFTQVTTQGAVYTGLAISPARSAATCWSAISALWPARSTPSTRAGISWALSRLTLAATCQAAFGPSASGPGA